ncbi:MAG: biotin/lipoyl-containing protein, partial [Acidobacteriota bacterium]
MTHIVKVPDIGEGIAEVELVEWHVQPGDSVAPDQVLADVMTDKATVEIPSPVTGKVSELLGEVGRTIAVGAELIRLEVEGAGNEKRKPAATTVVAPEQAGARGLSGSDKPLDPGLRRDDSARDEEP